MSKKKETKKTKPKIFVGIPTMDCMVHYHLMIQVYEWAKVYDISVNFEGGCFPVDAARNKLVNTFRDSDCTHLLFIDADIIPPPATLGKLLEDDKDIVSPVCLIMREENHFAAPMSASYRKDKNGKFIAHAGNGVDEVDVCTGGCFLVKRKVFEKMRRPFYMQYKQDGTVLHTEEYGFAQQARMRKFKLYTDYDLVCEHTRTCNLLQIKNTFDCLMGGSYGSLGEKKTVSC